MKLTTEQKEKLQKIGRSHNLRFIILHGSYAKGVSHKGSDLDIAILGRQRLSFDEILKIHEELTDIFGDNKDRELDLKTLHNVDHFFRYEVVRGSVLLYGDSNDYEEFKAYAYRDYEDSSDLRQLELLLLKKSINNISNYYTPYA